MRFMAIENLHWMWVILPLLVAGTINIIMKLRGYRNLGDPELIRQLTSHATRERELLQLILITLSLSGLVFAMARPQFGTHSMLLKRRGVDVVVALDVSKSMLAQDVPAQNTISRLERAKIEINGLIDRLKGDRIGLTAFAGAAFVQCPLTADYAAAKLFLRAMHPDNYPVPGTDFSEALRVAGPMFANARGGSRSKILIIVSDGEDHEGKYEHAWNELRATGVTIHTVGIGTQIGEQIPDQQDQYMRRGDKTIISRLNESLLRAMAESSGGTYTHSVAGDLGFEVIYDSLSRMQKTEYESRIESIFEEKYQIFVFASLMLLVAATLLPHRRIKPTERSQA